MSQVKSHQSQKDAEVSGQADLVTFNEISFYNILVCDVPNKQLQQHQQQQHHQQQDNQHQWQRQAVCHAPILHFFFEVVLQIFQVISGRAMVLHSAKPITNS